MIGEFLRTMLPWLNAGQAPEYGADGAPAQHTAGIDASEAEADPDIEEVPDEEA